MTKRSKDVWNESPVERLLMKLYRVPENVLTEAGTEPLIKRQPSKSPKETRAAARQDLQRTLDAQSQRQPRY